MADGKDQGPPLGEVTAPTGLGVLTVVLPLAGACACIAILSHGMVAVMNVGGRCVDNGMYAGAVHCPKGAGWTMPASIFLGLALVGLYAMRANAEKAPNFYLLFWTALFWSLGWNFFAFHDRGDASLPVLGVMFVGMGAAPLFHLASIAFPGLGPWSKRTFARPAAALGRMATEPSSEWGKGEAGAESTDGAARPDDAPATARRRLYSGKPSALWPWIVLQAAASVIGVYGGIAFFDWVSR